MNPIRPDPIRTLAALAAGCFLALHAAGGPADSPPRNSIRSVKPARSGIYRFVTLPGNIRARQQATLSAKVPGHLKTLTVDKGDRVTEGQVLGELEIPELTAERSRAQAEVVRAQAELEVAQIESDRLARAGKQSPDLVLPLALESAAGRLAMTRAAVTSAKASLQRTEILLNYSRIIAPFAGVVTMRFVDPGVFIPAATSTGSAQGSSIVTLMDFQSVRVQVAVPEIESPMIRTGHPVRLQVEGLPGRTFSGSVSRIAYALDESSRTMLAEADLPNPELLLRPGMYASIQLGVEHHADALLLPAAAVTIDKAGASVWAARAGHATRIAIKTGFHDGRSVEILGGLSESETILLPDGQSLTNGQPVTITEAR